MEKLKNILPIISPLIVLLVFGAGTTARRRRTTVRRSSSSRSSSSRSSSSRSRSSEWVTTKSGKRYKKGSDNYKAYMRRIANLRKARKARKK